MNILKKTLLWVSIILSASFQVALFTVVLFIFVSPQFGGSATDDQKKFYQSTGHYDEGIFLNDLEIKMDMNLTNMLAMMDQMMNPDAHVAPEQNIEVEKITLSQLQSPTDTILRVTWLGHSSFLIEMEGKKILLDPVFGKYAAPHPLLGKARYNEEMPIKLEDLKDIDAVIISHDHYDHLDYPTISMIKGEVKHFFVPLGVDNHLRSWDIAKEKISVLDWWGEESWNGLEIAFTPSRHMSGRGVTDQSTTLWGSWVVKGAHKSFYFSGDGGYGDHFNAIGNKYGPFDVALMECGQYNKLWADVHMMPEETAQASLDVRAAFIIPIHWGAFTLAAHSWTEPVKRLITEAKRIGVPIATPKIGESITVGQDALPSDKWWEQFE